MSWETLPADVIAVTADTWGRQKGHRTPPIFRAARGIWEGTSPPSDIDYGLCGGSREPRCDIRPGHEATVQAAQQAAARPATEMAWVSTALPDSRIGVDPAVAAYAATPLTLGAK